MKERIPPQNVEAEQSVLGALMLSKDAFASVIGQLQPEDFYVNRHAELFKAVLSLYQKNDAIDVIVIDFYYRLIQL